MDLEKLLPKSNTSASTSGYNDGNHLEWVHKDGHTFVVPVNDKGGRINGFCKWEQAFRMYATIYCGAYPNRAKEIWQYISVTNTAASSYSWENIYNYDVVFRHLMAFNPQRIWSIMYNQMWNLSMRDPIPKNQSKFSFGNGGFNNQSKSSTSLNTQAPKKHKKSIYCWNFNKGLKCKFGARCHFIEHCSYCNSPAHPIIECPKVDRKEKERLTEKLEDK